MMIEEISYIKNFAKIFTDPKFKEFFSVDILRKQIENEFNEKKEKYDQTDPFYHDLIENLERKGDEDLEAIDAFENEKKEK